MVDTISAIQELERRGYGNDPRVKAARERLQASGASSDRSSRRANFHANRDRGTPPPQRVFNATWSDDGTYAVRQGADGTLYDASYFMGQRPEDYAQRSFPENVAASFDRFFTMERNKSRRDYLSDNYGLAGEALAPFGDMWDMASGFADVVSLEATGPAVEGVGAALGALGVEGAADEGRRLAELRRQYTEQQVTGGGLSTAAMLGGMFAPIGLTSQAIKQGAKRIGSPVLKGDAPLTEAARLTTAAAATQQMATGNAVGWDAEQMKYINKTTPNELLGYERGEGPTIGNAELQYLPAILGGASLTPALTRGASTAARSVTDADFRARRIVGDKIAGDELRGLEGRGDMLPADLAPELAGSARRLGSNAAEAAVGDAMRAREAGRAERMQGAFSDAATAPSLRKIDLDIANIDKAIVRLGTPKNQSQRTTLGKLNARREKLVNRRAEITGAVDRGAIDGTQEFVRELDARRTDLGSERGYGRNEGLRISDEPMPKAMRDPTRELPADYSFRDEARALAQQGEKTGLAAEGRRLEILRDGETSKGGVRAIPADEFLNDFSGDQLNALLRNRGIQTSRNSDPELGPISKNLKRDQKLQILRRLRERDGENGLPIENNADVPVSQLRSMKTAANDLAQSAGQAGNRAASSAAQSFARRIRTLLAEGVRDGSGRRTSMIGDQYHAALSRAIESFEVSSGVKAADGSSAGPGFFKAKPEQLQRAMDDLHSARRAIEVDASLGAATRRNILDEFDRAFDAYRVGATRSYLDFLQQNPVSKGARVFNNDNVQMQARLRTLFDDEAEMQAFLRSVDDEGVMQATEREVLYGSQTAGRQAADAQLDQQTGGDASGSRALRALTGSVDMIVFDMIGAMLSRGRDRLLRGMTQATSDEIARLLTRQDFDALAAELEAARASRRLPSLANVPEATQARAAVAVERVADDAEDIPGYFNRGDGDSYDPEIEKSTGEPGYFNDQPRRTIETTRGVREIPDDREFRAIDRAGGGPERVTDADGRPLIDADPASYQMYDANGQPIGPRRGTVPLPEARALAAATRQPLEVQLKQTKEDLRVYRGMVEDVAAKIPDVRRYMRERRAEIEALKKQRSRGGITAAGRVMQIKQLTDEVNQLSAQLEELKLTARQAQSAYKEAQQRATELQGQVSEMSKRPGPPEVQRMDDDLYAEAAPLIQKQTQIAQEHNNPQTTIGRRDVLQNEFYQLKQQYSAIVARQRERDLVRQRGAASGEARDLTPEQLDAEIAARAEAARRPMSMDDAVAARERDVRRMDDEEQFARRRYRDVTGQKPRVDAVRRKIDGVGYGHSELIPQERGAFKIVISHVEEGRPDLDLLIDEELFHGLQLLDRQAGGRVIPKNVKSVLEKAAKRWEDASPKNRRAMEADNASPIDKQTLSDERVAKMIAHYAREGEGNVFMKVLRRLSQMIADRLRRLNKAGVIERMLTQPRVMARRFRDGDLAPMYRQGADMYRRATPPKQPSRARGGAAVRRQRAPKGD